MRSRTLGQPPMAQREQPPFVSIVPNQFPKPVPPGDFGLAAFDAAYSMAPYLIGPDDALVMTRPLAEVPLRERLALEPPHADLRLREPAASRGTARRRQLERDGSFRHVLAHRDPGLPNWIDTEGRPFGLVFWRFMLAEGEIETPRAEVVPFAEVGKRG